MATLNLVSATFKHILVPTDFSDASANALEYAKILARQGDAELLLAHVDAPLNPMTPPEAAWVNQSEYQAMHQEQLDQCGEALVSDGYRARTISLVGPLYDELLSTIESNQVDLLVLGTHGRHGVSRLLIGSDAEAILRRAHCPVLSVGPHAPAVPKRPWAIREVLCATTLDAESAEVAAYAYKLAAQNAAKLIFLHVKHAGKHEKVDWAAFEDGFRQSAPEEAGKATVQIRIAHVADASSIAEFAKQHHSDLIVMGARPSGSIATHFGPGTVAKVLMEAHCPVMTLLKQ